jgi:DNA anti-recombination protein RmuC
MTYFVTYYQSNKNYAKVNLQEKSLNFAVMFFPSLIILVFTSTKSKFQVHGSVHQR